MLHPFESNHTAIPRVLGVGKARNSRCGEQPNKCNQVNVLFLNYFSFSVQQQGTAASQGNGKGASWNYSAFLSDRKKMK